MLYSKRERSITKFVNIFTDIEASYELFLREGWMDECTSLDEFDVDDSLSMFEGDSDVIKYDGVTGYFALIGDTVYYYWDDYDTEDNAYGILRDFFAKGFQVHAGYYDYFWPEKRLRDGSWDDWDGMNRGIAYRGGCGYYYNFLPLR